MKNPLPLFASPCKVLFKTILLLLLPFCSFSQNQYWNIEYSGININPLPFGFLEVDENNVYALTNNSMKGYNFFGADIERNFNPFNGPDLDVTFFFERRSDILLAGEISQINSKMKMVAYDATSGDNLFNIDFQGVSETLEDAMPLGFKGILDDEYYMIDDQFIHKFRINGSTGYEELYNIEHGGNIFNYAIVKDNRIYLLTSTGSIYTLSVDGELNEVSTFAAKLNTAISIADGFLIGGEKDGENYIIKTDNDFNVQWSNHYNEKDCRRLFASQNQDYFVTGESNDGTGYLLKIDAAGNQLWKSSQLIAPGVAINENMVGNVFVLGRSYSAGIKNQLVKLGPEGEEGITLSNGHDPRFNVSSNNISASISDFGDLFFDGNDGQYFFPKDGETKTVFAGNLWLGGLDPGENLKLAANTYGLATGNSDFKMGPINAEDRKYFERVWIAKQYDIEAIRADLVDGDQNIDWYPDIVEWPAKGNTISSSDGETLLIEEDLAPFVDVNNDGIYNVQDGDYPKLKGDEMAWWIMNDDVIHTSTFGDQLKVEVVGTFYASGCAEDHISYNTTYLDYEITNKGTESILEFNAGLWFDPDLGCYIDDYIGSIPDQNAIIIYNEDEIDNNSGPLCDGAIPTFEDNPPIQSVVTLNRSMDHFMYYNSGAVGPPSPPGGATTDPFNAQGHYRYLIGRWQDGTPLTSGGNGYNPGSTDEVNFAYPGDPSDPNAWSLCSTNATEQDRRVVMSSDIGQVNPGESFNLSYALITSTDIELPCPALDIVKDDIATIQAMHDDYGNFHFDLGPDRNLQDQDPITLDPGAGGSSYAWSTGATTQTISVSNPGTYTVSITNAVGCEIIEEITIDLTDGLQNIEAQLLNIYPNPTSQYFTIDLPLDAAMLDISVLSIDGKLMLQKNNLVKGIDKYDIDASSWGSGIYFVKINSERGTHIGKVSVLR